MQQSSMKGRVAFVSGGASGIGRATVRALLDQGVNVAVADINEKALMETAQDFGSLGPEVFPIVADLADATRLNDWFHAAVAKFGRVDYLVNSVALLGGTRQFLDIQAEDWDRTFQLNVKTPMLLMQAYARHAIERGGGGRIVNLSSSSAFRAQLTRPAYGSSKGALNALTRIAAAQLGEYDINVNAVAPGLTNTPGLTSGGSVDVNVFKAKVSEGPNANFFKRLSEPEDVAATIVFLCSPGSRQITGQIIHVSAGAVTV
jgi:NAD(P)-dependent dehydrogenase (short-subunit alcohol dehydrogenase family)